MSTTTDRADGLRALDEEIARLRGWQPDEDGDWFETPSWAHGVPAYGDRLGKRAPPPFSREWSFAGPLLVEMSGGVAPMPPSFARPGWGWIAQDCGSNVLICRDVDTQECVEVWKGGSRGGGATPCEAIARAWLAWKKASA